MRRLSRLRWVEEDTYTPAEAAKILRLSKRRIKGVAFFSNVLEG